MDPLSALRHRRSTPSRLLGPPGPDPAQLRALLECAVRVPDHGKLAPWRFLAISGDARAALGEFVAARGLERDPGAAPAVIEKDRMRFSHAPLVLAVIARLFQDTRCPSRSSCFPAVRSASSCCWRPTRSVSGASGSPAGRLTTRRSPPAWAWAADERVLGFIHLGTPREPVPERDRPDPDGAVDGTRPMSARQPQVFLVDASMYVFRAWHSLPDEFQDHEGWPVNAVHGFTRFVLELLEKHRPPRMLFAFDAAPREQFPQFLLPGLQGQSRSRAGRTQAPVSCGAGRYAPRSASRFSPTNATRPTT
jgi:nitroreductase